MTAAERALLLAVARAVLNLHLRREDTGYTALVDALAALEKETKA